MPIHKLIERANFDLGVELFLQKVFIYASDDLKNCRVVCKEWNHFFETKVWKNPRLKKNLERKLCQQWKSDEPVRRYTLKIHLIPIKVSE